MFRKKLNRSYSKNMFSQNARRMHPRNQTASNSSIMRGGYRI